MQKIEQEVENNDITIKKVSKQTLFIKRTVIIFVLLLVVLIALNLAPTGVKEINNSVFSLFINDKDEKLAEKSAIENSKKNEIVLPLKIVIPKVGTDAIISNPKDYDVNDLNNALLLGAVRYPGSGDLLDNHTMFIFGHSSYLPVVHNKAYKTFNYLQKLSKGDAILLYSKDKQYRYSVESVSLVKADEGFVDLSSTEHELVLATCNSFGSKEERYLVKAKFVGSADIAN